jgi:hypothetical protein
MEDNKDELVVIKRSKLLKLYNSIYEVLILLGNEKSVIPTFETFISDAFPASEVFECGFAEGGVWQSSPEDKRDIDRAIQEEYHIYEQTKL